MTDNSFVKEVKNVVWLTYLDLNSDINWDSLFSYYVYLKFRSHINMFRIFIRTLQNTELKKLM